MIRAAALLALACGAAQAEGWLYRVALDPSTPQVARVTVELPAAHRAEDFSVQVRGMAMRLTPQVSDPRCDGVPIAADSAGAWRVQGWSCVRLSWQVPMKAVAAATIDPRARESVYEPQARFWIFSEASSLLRPVDAAAAGEVEFSGGPVHGGAPVAGTARRVVPASGQAVEFYVIGRLPVTALRVGGGEVRHVDAAGVDLRDLAAEHRRALRYFIQTAALRKGLSWETAVVWLPGADDGGTPVVEAGHRTVLLAVAARRGRVQHAEATLAELLRGEFAQLMPSRVPLWARESLAQFYAVKAMRRSGLPPEAVSAVERRLVDLPRAPTVQLRQAQARLQAGDEQARGALRAAGAAFWDRIDRAIVRKSGVRTLDSLLARLLASPWPDDRLPPAVVEQLRRYGAIREVDELLAQYVGS